MSMNPTVKQQLIMWSVKKKVPSGGIEEKSVSSVNHVDGIKKVRHTTLSFFLLFVPPADAVPILLIGRGKLHFRGYHGLLN